MADLPWRTVIGIFCAAVVILVVSGALKGGPLLSATGVVSLLVVAAMTFIDFAALRRHYR